ncbi:MAG: hypothetical protein ACP5OX_00810 [Minisyncoccia bacterium]
MNEENFPQNQNFNQGSPFPPINQFSPSASENKEEPFAPPQSNIFIRTSDSDLGKIKGEGEAVFTPSNEQMPSQPPKPMEEVSFAPSSGFTPPSEPHSYISPQEGSAITPEIPASEMSGFPSAPPLKKKFLPFIIIGVLIVAGAALGYFILWPKIFGPKKVVEVTTTTTTSTTTTTTLPPSPYVSLGSPYTKSIVNVEIKGSPVLTAIRKAATDEISPFGTFKILIPKIKGVVLNDEEIILSLIPKMPESLKPYVLGDKKFLIYAYYGEINPCLGLIVEIGQGNKEMVKPIFLNWEKKLQILNDLTNFYLIKVPTRIGKAFKDANNLGAEIRTFDYKGNEVDLTYAFFDKYLIISSSLESVNSALERLQKPLEVIYP